MPQSRPKYPAGEPINDPASDRQVRSQAIAQLQSLPGHLNQIVAPLTDSQLATQYVNWTVRQIVNHLADSHMNAFIRFKLALTETNPTIKPYDETAWAKLPDADIDPNVSIRLLEPLHQRWAHLLHSMCDADFDRSFFHPEGNRIYTLGQSLLIYSWHGVHHMAQIELLCNHYSWSK